MKMPPSHKTILFTSIILKFNAISQGKEIKRIKKKKEKKERKEEKYIHENFSIPWIILHYKY